jgi:endoplasmic reticulum resident protein 44
LYFVLAAIAARYQINKYPTLKLYRYGALSKREYRGARTAEAFIEFLKDQLKSPIKQIDYTYSLQNVDVSIK